MKNLNGNYWLLKCTKAIGGLELISVIVKR